MTGNYEPPLLSSVLPEFARELAARLAEHPDGEGLVSQLDRLPILSRCRCREPGCASFTTGATDGRAPAQTVPLLGGGPWASDVILDLRDGKIVYVEILDRPDIAQILDALFERLRRGTV